jgi:hypothetical protein
VLIISSLEDGRIAETNEEWIRSISDYQAITQPTIPGACFEEVDGKD